MATRETGLKSLADAAAAATQGVGRENFEIAFRRLTAGDDSSGLSDLLSRHRLAPLVYLNIERFNRAENTPAEILNRLKEAYFSTLAHNALQERKLRELLQAAAEAGADVIPIKGAAIAQTWYEQPGVRFAGDIDLLVREENLTRFDRAARSVGFTESPAPDRHWTRTYIHPEPPGVIVECQWNLWLNFRLGFPFDSFWDKTGEANLLGVPAALLDPVNEILLSAFHFASHHHYRGPLLWLHDIMLMLPETPEADAAPAGELLSFAGEYGCRRLLRSVFLLIEGFWGDARRGWSTLFSVQGERAERYKDMLLHRTAVRAMLKPEPWRGARLDMKMLLCALLLLEGRSTFGYFRRRFG